MGEIRTFEQLGLIPNKVVDGLTWTSKNLGQTRAMNLSIESKKPTLSSAIVIIVWAVQDSNL